jgi:hypothetical protein
MRVLDEGTEEVFVGRDQARSLIEVRIGDAAADGPRVMRLSREEARRLAALLLFHVARLGRPLASWGPSRAEPERESA